MRGNVEGTSKTDPAKAGRKARKMSEHHEKPVIPDRPEASRGIPAENAGDRAELKRNMLAQVKKMVPVVFGLSKADPYTCKEQLLHQAGKLISNPGQFSEDFLDSVFGTGANGISRADDAEEAGKLDFELDLPDPVRMPDAYSVAYHRLDNQKKDVVTLLERDDAGNLHYLDAGKEDVFVRTEDGFRRYPVHPEQKGFGKWDGVLLSARGVRRLTDHFWNIADQTFLKWLGVERKEETEYLGRPCGLYHAQPGTLTFTYQCDMIIDDETGICLGYTANELLKGAVFNQKEDGRIRISIGDYHIGGAEMNFYCTKFETKNISFDIPAV
jgi:hypothetical protein